MSKQWSRTEQNIFPRSSFFKSGSDFFNNSIVRCRTTSIERLRRATSTEKSNAANVGSNDIDDDDLSRVKMSFMTSKPRT